MNHKFFSPTSNREMVKSLIYYLERKFPGHRFTHLAGENSIATDFTDTKRVEDVAVEFVGRAGQLASRLTVEVVARSESTIGLAKYIDLAGVKATDVEGVFCLGAAEAAAMRLLDAAFKEWATSIGGIEISAPCLVSCETLHKAGYLEKEAHQIGHVHHSGHEICCLSPAACLTTYPILARSPLAQPRSVFTLLMPVFRMEGGIFPADAPLSRLREYQVREVIFFGDRAFVDEMKALYFEFMVTLAKQLRIPFELASASDLFFHSESSTRALHQLVNKTKYEMNFIGPAEHLALSSFNIHDRHFVEAFGINGPVARLESACVGFGLQRWLRALILVHGSVQQVDDMLRSLR